MTLDGPETRETDLDAVGTLVLAFGYTSDERVGVFELLPLELPELDKSQIAIPITTSQANPSTDLTPKS